MSESMVEIPSPPTEETRLEQIEVAVEEGALDGVISEGACEGNGKGGLRFGDEDGAGFRIVEGCCQGLGATHVVCTWSLGSGDCFADTDG